MMVATTMMLLKAATTILQRQSATVHDERRRRRQLAAAVAVKLHSRLRTRKVHETWTVRARNAFTLDLRSVLKAEVGGVAQW